VQVIGLLKQPLEGNPNASMGLIAHPGQVCLSLPALSAAPLTPARLSMQPRPLTATTC
jgi:hypothetical protein